MATWDDVRREVADLPETSEGPGLEWGVCGTLGKESQTLPQDHGMDHQEKLVDEVALHQRPNELTAAEDYQRLFGLALEALYRGGNVAHEKM